MRRGGGRLNLASKIRGCINRIKIINRSEFILTGTINRLK